VSGERADRAATVVTPDAIAVGARWMDMLGLLAPGRRVRSRRGSCLRRGLRGTLMRHLRGSTGEVALLPSGMVGTSPWGALIPHTGATKALHAGLFRAGTAAVDVAAVAVRADAGELPAAAADIDPVRDIVVWVDVLRPPGDTDRGPRFERWAGAMRVRSCSSRPSPVGGRRCSAAGFSLWAVLGRYATCGRPVLCSADREGSGGQARVAPETGGFRCPPTWGYTGAQNRSAGIGGEHVGGRPEWLHDRRGTTAAGGENGHLGIEWTQRCLTHHPDRPSQ